MGLKRPGQTQSRTAFQGVEEAVNVLKPVKVDHLPCKLHHDGPANVQAFWRPEATGERSGCIRDGDGRMAEILQATFRGRLLMGARLDLKAAGMRGFVFQPRKETFHQLSGPTSKRIRLSQEPGCQDAQIDQEKGENESMDHWECLGSFEELTAWNFDQHPSDHDEVRRWLDWVPISKVLVED